MLCSKCHKNLATVRYAEVIDGKVTDQRLCAECLRRIQQDETPGFELAALPSHHASSSLALEEAVGMGDLEMCHSCWTEFSRVLETGRVGCSMCYTAFADQLESLLEGIHSAMRHHGKTPHFAEEKTQLHERLQTKRTLLRSAIASEDFEEAARLRDEIRALEQRLGTGGERSLKVGAVVSQSKPEDAN